MTPAPPRQTRLDALLSALRYRNFRLFFSSQFISVSGTWIQSIAQSWLVYRLTDSAVWLGVISFVSLVPVFLFASLGGALADRYSRRRIVLTTQVLSMILALLLATLTLTDRVEVWHVALLATLLGLVNAADIPARQAFVVQLVGKEALLNAIALNSSMFNAARVVGPSLAGVIVALLGEGWCFLINGLSYSVVIVTLLRLRLPPHVPQPRTESTLRHLGGGFRFVLATPPVRSLLLLLGLISLTAMPYAVLMPIFASRILGGGPSTFGLLMASAGVGALCGALTLATRRGLAGMGRWIAIAAGGLGVSLILFAGSRLIWLSALLLASGGFSMMIQMAGSNTLIQMMVPDALRGRVMAIYSMMFMGMAPFGSLLAGGVAGATSAPVAVAGGGLICLLAAGVFWHQLPALRGQLQGLIAGERATAPAGTPPPRA